MRQKIFSDFDFSDFWEDSEYALREYVEEKPSDELILSIEKELGYKFPDSYIELMKLHNGGIPKNTCYPTNEPTSWSADHIAITGIKGIGRTKLYSLCGELGSQFKITEWEYPNDGIYICDCPSAGHDMIMLDYSKCGNSGEPEVVHVDQEHDYKKTFIAKDFETFIRGLVNSDVYDTSEEDLNNTLEVLQTGNFSSLLQEFFKNEQDIEFDKILRKVLTNLANSKGFLALHADELSYLVYDIQFYLYSKNKIIKSNEAYLKDYPNMIAFSDNEIGTGGYAEDFVKDWFKERISQGQISKNLFGGFSFNKQYEKSLIEQMKKYE